MPAIRRLRPFIAPGVIGPVTLVLSIPMFIVALVRLVVPVDFVRRACQRSVTGIARAWISVVVWSFRQAYDTRVRLEGDVDFQRGRSYLLLCNHLSWVDVPMLLWAFDRRLPFYRFFLKHSLIWIPVLGIAFWALDYPFIRFRSSAYLKRHPERRGERLETARRACERLRGRAATVVNFPEGALFTRARHQRQKAGYRHLLRPHAGGPALVMTAMGDDLDALLDVTLHYPDGVPGMIDLLRNRIANVRIHVRRIPIPEALRSGEYRNDPEFRARVRRWLNAIWHEKDALIADMKRESRGEGIPE